MGVGRVVKDGKTVVVVHYSPAGNVVGEFLKCVPREVKVVGGEGHRDYPYGEGIDGLVEINVGRERVGKGEEKKFCEIQ